MSSRKCICLILFAGLLLFAVPVHAAALKIATLLPDGSSYMNQIREAAAEIAQRTEGRVTFKFYPGGTMGNDKNVLRKIRVGQLHGGAVTGGGLAEIYPEDQIYNLPFLFSSYDEVDYVRERIDPQLMKGLEERGFVTFGLIEGGFAYLLSNKPIQAVEDVHGQKVWIPEGDEISRMVFDSIGISPIPLPLTDVLTGLQTGLVNTVGTSPIGAVTLQWFTKVKYMTDTPLLYFYGTIAVSTKAFYKIAPEDQTVIRDVMTRVVKKLDGDVRESNRGAREALANQGIEFVKPSPEELAKWHQIAAQSIDKLGERGVYSKPMLQELRSLLEKVRHPGPEPDSPK